MADDVTAPLADVVRRLSFASMVADTPAATPGRCALPATSAPASPATADLENLDPTAVVKHRELQVPPLHTERVLRALDNGQLKANAEREVVGLREHFEKLKFNFTELKTKHLFLEAISNKRSDKDIPKERIDQLEASVEEGKKAVQSIKAANKSVREELSPLIEACLTEQDDLAREKDTFAAELEAFRVDITQLKESHAADAEHARERAAAEAALADKTAANRALEATVAGQQSIISDKEAQIQALTEQIARLRASLPEPASDEPAAAEPADEADEGDRGEEPAAAAVDPLRTMHDTYVHASHLVENLGQMRFAPPIDEEMSSGAPTTITLPKGQRLLVHFRPGSSDIIDDAELVGIAGIGITDLVAFVRGTTKLSFLVCEAAMRLDNHDRRESEFAALRNALPAGSRVAYDHISKLTVALPDGRCVVLSVDHDYPEAHSCAIVLQVDGFATTPQDAQAVYDGFADEENRISRFIHALVNMN